MSKAPIHYDLKEDLVANILLTQQCVRSCPYCFAKKHMADSKLTDVLAWEDLVHIADLFDKGPDKHLSLLGGEPTLHPDYVDFALYLIARGFREVTFTSGIMSPKKLDAAIQGFKDCPEGSFSFVCNLNHPSMSSPEELERIDAFLRAFGPQTALSFNIFSLDFSMDYLFDAIERYGLRKNIRLGLAHPIPGETNECIPADKIKEMASRLVSYVPEFIKRDLVPGFDCGFPLCDFTDEQIGKLFKLEHGSQNRGLKFVCNPAIDIGPDMQVWSCFPLSRFNKRSLYEFDSVEDIMAYFKSFHVATRERDPGIYAKCGTCSYRATELCAGGCLAHSLNHLGETHMEAKAGV